ncbi:MAG: pilus assembly protein PilM, partial [Planctomycetes bacterium]|nr:pilus assembly protein PilM [Planctomycetota bacterium]
ETDEIRYIVAGNVYQGEDIRNEVIFFGAGRDDITGHLEMLEEAQLSPVAIDSVPCALFRSFRGSLRRQEDQETVSVFIDVGDEVTTVIIGRGQQIAFIKQIPIASNQLNAKVASILGVTTDQAVLLRSKLRNSGSETGDAATTQEIVDATGGVIEELAREVSLCFRYYAVTFRGQRPSQAVFAGVEAQEPALLDALKRHMGIEIKIAQPLRGFDLTRADFSSEEQSALCQWAVAVGLSIKGWDIPEEGGDSYERN